MKNFALLRKVWATLTAKEKNSLTNGNIKKLHDILDRLDSAIQTGSRRDIITVRRMVADLITAVEGWHIIAEDEKRVKRTRTQDKLLSIIMEDKEDE